MGLYLRRDIAERTGKLVTKIKWGDPSCEPSFWAHEYAPWSLVTNIAHPQVNKFSMIMAEILKICIQRRLEQKGLDPLKHVTQNVNLVTQKNKERIRKGRGHRKHTQASKSPLSDVFLDEPMPVLDSEAGLTEGLDVYGIDVDYNVDDVNVNVLDTIDTDDLLQPEQEDQHEEEALLASSDDEMDDQDYDAVTG